MNNNVLRSQLLSIFNLLSMKTENGSRTRERAEVSRIPMKKTWRSSHTTGNMMGVIHTTIKIEVIPYHRLQFEISLALCLCCALLDLFSTIGHSLHLFQSRYILLLLSNIWRIQKGKLQSKMRKFTCKPFRMSEPGGVSPRGYYHRSALLLQVNIVAA